MLKLSYACILALFSLSPTICLSQDNASNIELTRLTAASTKTVPTKVVIISKPLVLGGIERVLINMINALDPERIQLDLVLLGRVQEGPLEKELKRDIPIITFKEACQKQYDVAISYHQFLDPDIFLHHMQAHKKIQWIHGDMLEFHCPYNSEKKCKNIDLFVCVSKRVREVFVRLHPDLQEKSLVITNIIDSARIIQGAEIDSAQEIQRDGLLNVVTVSRLDFKKGLQTALKAHKRLDREGINFRWYLVGEGPERAVLMPRIQQYGLQNKFILLGGKKNPYPYIKKADLFVLPSRSEGYSTVLVEAKILKRPIITTDIGGAQEEIVSGKNGLIVPTTEDALFLGMKKMLLDSSLREQFALSLKNFEYDNTKSLQKIYQLLQEP